MTDLKENTADFEVNIDITTLGMISITSTEAAVAEESPSQLHIQPSPLKDDKIRELDPSQEDDKELP